MLTHSLLTNKELRKLFRQRSVLFAGNSKLKIYGTLHCGSGKRMKKENRVFFTSQDDVEKQGFRPCGHCMKREYKNWKNECIR